jgi:hypothetical protein
LIQITARHPYGIVGAREIHGRSRAGRPAEAIASADISGILAWYSHLALLRAAEDLVSAYGSGGRAARKGKLETSASCKEQTNQYR